jgi:N-acetylglucosaminyl-diphospho-decaprenol L-rhamnosyltransferase
VKTTIGVLPHNSEHMLPDLLKSLPAGLAGVPDWKLIVADNGSTDRTVDVVRDLAPDATIVEMGANLGFAAGINAAAAADPHTEAVLILSPTARLKPGAVAEMLNVLRSPGVGIVVPRLYSGTGELRRSLRRSPTVLRAFAESLIGGTLASRWAPLSEVIGNPTRYSATTRAAWATGGVTMMSRECLDVVGPWNETFFLYSEEVDFALRAADHGFRLAFAPDAQAVHIGGVSRVRPELFALHCANRVRLHAMRNGAFAASAYWLATVTGEVIRSVRPSGQRHRAAFAKLVREARNLVRGRPAVRPFAN